LKGTPLPRGACEGWLKWFRDAGSMFLQRPRIRANPTLNYSYSSESDRIVTMMRRPARRLNDATSKATRASKRPGGGSAGGGVGTGAVRSAGAGGGSPAANSQEGEGGRGGGANERWAARASVARVGAGYDVGLEALASVTMAEPNEMEEVYFDCDVHVSHLGCLLKIRDDITSKKWQGIFTFIPRGIQ